MGILDKAKSLIGKHEEKLDDAIDKAADVADDKTGGKHTDKIESAADKAHEVVDKLSDGGEGDGDGDATQRTDVTQHGDAT